MNKEILIVRHLNGTLSKEEKVDFTYLMESDMNFKTSVEQSMAVWKTSESIKPSSDVNVDLAWKEFEELNNNRRYTVEQTSKPVKMWNWRMLTRVAAVALIILASVIALNQSRRDDFQAGLTYTAEDNHDLLLSMADGSEAFLAGNSQLEIEDEYNRERRTTRLSGTAFFVVKPDKDKVFEVVTDHLKTIVKGTTFLVRTNDHSTTVGVQTGVVEVLVGNQTEILMAGEQVTVSSPGGMIERSDLIGKDVAALKGATRAFKNAPLSSILSHVEILYSVKIEADEKLLNQLFTVDFGTADTEEMLDILKTLTQTTVHKKGEIYVLKQ